MSKPSSSKRKSSKSISKVAPKAVTKRSHKAAEAEAELAACKAEEAERIEQVVRTLVLGSFSSSYIHLILLSQHREWTAIVARNPPLKTLTPDDLPQSGKGVPHRLYGWPFSEDYMLDYARRHRLVLKVIPHYRKVFGDVDYFNYGDITDDHLADEQLFHHLRRMALLNVISHFHREGGAFDLKIDLPLSQEWRRILVVWSTKDYEEMYNGYKWYGDWPKVEKFIDDALNECLPEGCERRTSLAWWKTCGSRHVSRALLVLFGWC